MKKRIVTLIGTTLMMATSALYTAAQTDQTNTPSPADSLQAGAANIGEDGPGGGRGPNGLLRILRVLDLSDEQKTAVKSILERELPTFQQLIRGLVKVRKDLREAAAPQGSFDRETVRKLATEEGLLSARLFVLRAATLHEIYQTVLTSDQQKDVDLILKFLQPPIRESSDESGS